MIRTLILIGLTLIIISCASLAKVGVYSFAGVGTSTSGDGIGEFYVYLFASDKIDFKYSFRNVGEWFINITLIKLSSGEFWSYIDNGIVSEPLTPIFSAPSTGIYLGIIRFNSSKHGVMYFSFSVDSSSIDYRIMYLAPKITITLIIGIVLVILGVFGRLRSVPRFISIISWELYGFWRFWLSTIIMFTLLSAIMLFGNTSSFQGFYPEKYFTKLKGLISTVWIVGYGDPLGEVIEKAVMHINPSIGKEMFWYMYYIYIVIICVSMFSYEIERKVLRDRFIIGVSRGEAYWSKLISCIILAVYPLFSLHLVLMPIVDTSLVITHTLRFLNILGARLLMDLGLAIITLSYAFIPAIVLSKPLYALLVCFIAPFIVKGMGIIPQEYSPERFIICDLYYWSNVVPYLVLFTAFIIIGYVIMRYRDYA